MQEIVQKTEEFLNRYKIDADQIDMDQLITSFLSEMEKGLAGDRRSSLKMIPTYTTTSETIPADQPVIVIDAGGTNLRTCLVRFDQEKNPRISEFKKTSMPGVKSEVTAKEFFAIIADEVERLIDLSDRIGFCFSYAAEITPDRDGIPLVFSKEIKAPEVIGMPLGKSLLAELARRGHDVRKKKVAVLNDTVATLLAGQGTPSEVPYSGYVGFILGTGTNTAYIESNKKIVKLSADPSKTQIINIESGNFDYCPGPFDRKFFDSTKEPDQYHLEKMISGAYLGPICGSIITEAIHAGLFSETFGGRYAERIQTLSTTVMSNYLEMPFNSGYELVQCVEGDDGDAHVLWLIINAVIERAAKLTAANLTSTILKSGSGTDPRKPVCINADGTTLYKTEYLLEYTNFYLHHYLQRRYKRYYRFVRIDDSPTIGSAVAALGL